VARHRGEVDAAAARLEQAEVVATEQGAGAFAARARRLLDALRG
jgi:hypothetical protein